MSIARSMYIFRVGLRNISDCSYSVYLLQDN